MIDRRRITAQDLEADGFIKAADLKINDIIVYIATCPENLNLDPVITSLSSISAHSMTLSPVFSGDIDEIVDWMNTHPAFKPLGQTTAVSSNTDRYFDAYYITNNTDYRYACPTKLNCSGNVVFSYKDFIYRNSYNINRVVSGELKLNNSSNFSSNISGSYLRYGSNTINNTYANLWAYSTNYTRSDNMYPCYVIYPIGYFSDSNNSPITKYVHKDKVLWWKYYSPGYVTLCSLLIGWKVKSLPTDMPDNWYFKLAEQ